MSLKNIIFFSLCTRKFAYNIPKLIEVIKHFFVDFLFHFPNVRCDLRIRGGEDGTGD